MPTREKTRSTGGPLAATHIVAPVASARREARTSAVMPAESQNVVTVMSTTRPSAPLLSTDSSASRMSSAMVRSISAGNLTTAVRPYQDTRKRSSDTTTPPFTG